MAFRHGKNAGLSVDSNDLSAYLDSIDFSVDVDTADTTTFGDDWKTAIPGLAGAKLSIKGNYDPTASTGPDVVLSGLIGGDAVTCIYYPGGNTTGQRSVTFDAILTSYAPSSPVGDKVSFSADFLVTGEATWATIS